MLELDQALLIMFSHLHRKKARVNRIAEFWNGFEGWLKFELAVALRRHAGVEVWSRTEDGRLDYGEVGVEYRYRRAPGAGGDAEELVKEKLIDFWYGYSPTLYFELKSVFANANQGKQIQSWRSDFDKLGQVLKGDETAVGYASVLISVGFDEDRWHSTLNRAKLDETLPGAFWNGGLIVNREAGPIRLCALRYALPPRS